MENETNIIPISEAEVLKIDEKKIKELTEKLDKKKKELSTKLYAVKMSKEEFETYANFFRDDVEWIGKQSLGVYEITKKIEDIKSEGIKDGVIYLRNLEIEASHFFLNSHRGKGSENAYAHMRILKNIEEALYSLSPDNKEVKDLESELAAAHQGLEIA
jgi:hypothetical protein